MGYVEFRDSQDRVVATARPRPGWSSIDDVALSPIGGALVVLFIVASGIVWLVSNILLALAVLGGLVGLVVVLLIITYAIMHLSEKALSPTIRQSTDRNYAEVARLTALREQEEEDWRRRRG